MFLKEENGAVQIIEATVVYPLVVLAAVSMIFLGMYVFETALLNDRADALAVTAAKTLTFSGYDEFGDIYTELCVPPNSPQPDRKSVEKAFGRNRPYRYLLTGETDSRFSDSAAEYASGLMFPSDQTVCKVEVRRNLFDREVAVIIEKEIRLPSVLKIAGINEYMKITASASASTSDPAEFIRNTDLVVNSAAEFAEKSGASEKLTEIRTRISGILEKIKAGIR